MKDIDRISRHVPCLCKVAPAIADVHIEDVHRAGGIMSILGELDRAGLLHTDVPTVHSDHGRGARQVGHQAHHADEAVFTFYRAAPGGVPTQVAFSQDRRWKELDADRQHGIIRDKAHAFTARTAASPCCTATSPRRAAS
jgi:dihydroxy-acid dehydratase